MHSEQKQICIVTFKSNDAILYNSLQEEIGMAEMMLFTKLCLPLQEGNDRKVTWLTQFASFPQEGIDMIEKLHQENFYFPLQEE